MKPDFKKLGASLLFIVIEVLVVVLFPFAWSYDKASKLNGKETPAA